jgi:hypothetical protein
MNFRGACPSDKQARLKEAFETRWKYRILILEIGKMVRRKV